MIYDEDNFFNRSIHDAVKDGGDHWRNYQKLHAHERVAMDQTFDNHESTKAWIKTDVMYAGLSVARRYANWG